MTNFDYLLPIKEFAPFVKPAREAELVYPYSKVSSMFNIRKSIELTLKSLCAMENISAGDKPKLIDLLKHYQIRDLMPFQLLKSLDLIRKAGNAIVHENKEPSETAVKISLRTLFELLDWMAYNYEPPGSNIYQEGRQYNPELLNPKEKLQKIELPADKPITKEENAKQLELIKQLKEQLSAANQQLNNLKKPPYVEPIPEAETRKLYIDLMLENAGWVKGKNWLEEVEVYGMPTKSGKGKIDYVLYGDDGIPLAIIEAKKTTVDLYEGSQQAKLYADQLAKKYKRRPVIFLSNGIRSSIIDNDYPERRIADFYSKTDLEKYFNLRKLKQPLFPVHSDDKIAGRYYQKAAIQAICSVLDKKKRKALLVMATGSGKTRTAAALIDYLIKKGWVTNVLFLADRTMLVKQAKKAITDNLPNVSVTNLCDNKKEPDARVVCSTYQTMIGLIDTYSDENGRVFTPGHFDLIICDEVHRSIYNKFKDIFTYFDTPIIGLTATPKEDIDHNTFELFDVEQGDPTYAYTLEQGVKDHYLVDYETVETGTKFINEGITYDDLTEEEKEDYEDQFEDEEGKLPYHISASEMNKTLFNKDTIRKVLGILMQEGLKVDYGNKIGKTIIFARNHKHAQMILDVFKSEYPELGDDFAQIIDNYCYDVMHLKEQFENPNKLPQIAISVDMMDTGVDVPSILNLVFFKKVMSKAKFWQMIGRGTRTCPGLIDGKDKKVFRIFDFMGNFEFFRENKNPIEARGAIPIQGAIFKTMFEMVYKLQEPEYQTPELQKYREHLVDIMSRQIKNLNRSAFNVVQHLELVDRYSNPEGYKNLKKADINKITKELIQLIQSSSDHITATRFDSLLYGIELAGLYGKKSKAAFQDLQYKASQLQSSLMDIPEVKAQEKLINHLVETENFDQYEIDDLENIRNSLRSLMKYINPEKITLYETDYKDLLLDPKITQRDIQSIELKSYKQRAETYIREHQDAEAIRKLKNNEELTEKDIKQLEGIMWDELGTKADYEAEFASRPLGEFVRSITGLNPVAAKEAFAKYIDEASLDEDQINFLNQVIDYITYNGTLKKQVLMQSPFSDFGGVMLFSNDQKKLESITKGIEDINRKALFN